MIDVPIEIISWMTDSKFNSSTMAIKLISADDKYANLDPRIFQNGVMFYYLAKRMIDVKKNFNFMRGVQVTVSMSDSKVVRHGNWKKIQDVYKKMGILIDDSIKEQIIEGNPRIIMDVFTKIYQKFVDPKFQLDVKRPIHSESAAMPLKPTTKLITNGHSIRNSTSRMIRREEESLESTLLSILSGKHVNSLEKKENKVIPEDRQSEVVDQNISILQNNNSNYNLYAKKKQRRKFALSPIAKKSVVAQKSPIDGNFQQEYRLINSGMNVGESENLFQVLILLVSRVFRKSPKESLSFFFNHNEELNRCLLEGFNDGFDQVLEFVAEIKRLSSLISRILSKQDYLLLDSFVSIFKNINKSASPEVIRLFVEVVSDIVGFLASERSVMVLNQHSDSLNEKSKATKFTSSIKNDNDGGSLFDKITDLSRKDKIRSDNILVYYMYFSDCFVADLASIALGNRVFFRQVLEMLRGLFVGTFTFVNFLEMAKLKLNRNTYFKLVHRLLVEGTVDSFEDSDKLEIVRFIMADINLSVLSRSTDKVVGDKSSLGLDSSISPDALRLKSVVLEQSKPDSVSRSLNKYIILVKILNRVSDFIRINNSIFEIVIGKMNSLLFMFPSNKLEINDSLISFLNMEKIELSDKAEKVDKADKRSHSHLMEMISQSNKKNYDKSLRLINSSNVPVKSANRDIPNVRIEFLLLLQEILHSRNTNSLELVELIFATFSSVLIFDSENQMSVKEIVLDQLQQSTNSLCAIYFDRYLSTHFTDYIVKIVKKKSFLYSWENSLMKRYIRTDLSDPETIAKWAKTLCFMLLNFSDILDSLFEPIQFFFNEHQDSTLLITISMIRDMITFIFEVESKASGASFELSGLNIGSVPDLQQINRKAIHIYKDIKKQKYFVCFLLSLILDRNTNSKTREYIKIFSVFYNSKKSDAGEETGDNTRKKKKSSAFKTIISLILAENPRESIDKLEKHVQSLVKTKNALKKEFISLYINDQVDFYLFPESKTHKQNTHGKGITFNDIKMQVSKTIQDSILRFKDKQEKSLLAAQTLNQKQLALVRIARESSLESYKSNVVNNFAFVEVGDLVNIEQMNIEQYYSKYHYFFKAVYNFYLEQRFVREIIYPDIDHNYKLILKSYMGKRKQMSYGCIWRFVMDFKLTREVDYHSLVGRIIIPFKNIKRSLQLSEDSIDFNDFKLLLLNIFCLFFKRDREFISQSDLERFNESIMSGVKSKVRFLLNYLKYPLLLDFEKAPQYGQACNELRNGKEGWTSELFESRSIYSYAPKAEVDQSKLVVDNILSNLVNVVTGDSPVMMSKEIEFTQETTLIPAQLLREDNLTKSQIRQFPNNQLRSRVFRNKYQMEMDRINREIKSQKDLRDQRIKNRKKELVAILKNYKSTKLDNSNGGGKGKVNRGVPFKRFSVSRYIGKLETRRLRKEQWPKRYSRKDHHNRLTKQKDAIARISTNLKNRNSTQLGRSDFISKLILFSQTKSLDICKTVRPETRTVIDNIKILHNEFLENSENDQVIKTISKLYRSIYSSLNKILGKYRIGVDDMCFDSRLFYRFMHSMSIVPSLFNYSELTGFFRNYVFAKREEVENHNGSGLDVEDFQRMVEWIYLTKYNELVDIYMNNESEIVEFMSSSVNSDLKHVWDVVEFNLNASLVVKYKALCGLLFVSFNRNRSNRLLF